jgi:hypothetical protein
VICDLLDSFRLEPVTAYQEVPAERLLLCDPLLARHPIDGLPKPEARVMDVLCPYAGGLDAAFDPRRRRMPTKGELEALFGVPCRFVDIDPGR